MGGGGATASPQPPADATELQGHAIKNKDLLAAAGVTKLRGTESWDALAEDEEAVSIGLVADPALMMAVPDAAAVSEPSAERGSAGH